MQRYNSSIRLSFSLFLLLAVFGCQSGPRHGLVELDRVIPDIVLDIRYATANNFVGKVLYPSARCFLAKDPAMALKQVQTDLQQQGFRLKVYDAYRPLSVQKQMWAILPDDHYVADPATGSNHNRAYSVDVTLLDPEGNEVLMPSEFDDFSERAHMDYMDCPAEAIHHRQILNETMERHGFSGIDSEWWHFNYQGYKDKPVLDIPIDQL